MFITAKSALIDNGAHGREMPFEVTVEYKRTAHSEWTPEVKGRNIDYLADWYTDLKVLWPRVRLINSATGRVLFYG